MDVNRHKITESKLISDDAISTFDSMIDNGFKRIIENENINLQYSKDFPLIIAREYIMRGEKDKYYPYLELTLDISVEHFNRVIADDDLTIQLGGHKLQISSVDKKHGVSYFDWFHAFSLAILLNSKMRRDELMNMDIFRLNQVGDPFWEFVVRFLRVLMSESTLRINLIYDELIKHLESGKGLFIGKEKSSIRNIEGRVEGLKAVWFPILKLFKIAYDGNDNKFNEVLESYLIEKKSFLIKNKMQDASRFWVDFPGMAACAYAYRRGITIDVQSEYIPKWVYERDL